MYKRHRITETTSGPYYYYHYYYIVFFILFGLLRAISLRIQPLNRWGDPPYATSPIWGPPPPCIEIYPVDSAVHLLNNSSPRMPRHIRDLLTVQSAKFKKLSSAKVAKIQRE